MNNKDTKHLLAKNGYGPTDLILANQCPATTPRFGVEVQCQQKKGHGGQHRGVQMVARHWPNIPIEAYTSGPIFNKTEVLS